MHARNGDTACRAWAQPPPAPPLPLTQRLGHNIRRIYEAKIRARMGKILFALLLFLSCLQFVLGYVAITQVHSDISRIQTKEVNLFENAWKIKWLDEVLTTSVVRFGQSKGDPSWRTRYDSHAIQLDYLIAASGSLIMIFLILM